MQRNAKRSMGEGNHHPTTGTTTTTFFFEKRTSTTTTGGSSGEDEGGGHDLISFMSDDILLRILSSASIRDAVRTGAVSSRWKDLWKSVPVLNITGDWGPRFDPAEYCEIVGRILLQRPRDQLLTAFEVVHAPLREEHSSHLDSWIGFVAAKGAKRVGLVLSDVRSRRAVRRNAFKGLYKFPYLLFLLPRDNRGGEGNIPPSPSPPSLESLTLSFVRLEQLPGGDFKGFSSLKYLSLRDVDMDETLRVHDILCACPVLESLTLGTGGWSDAACLRICHGRLKHLFLDGVTCLGVEISCSSLIGFKFSMNRSCGTTVGFVDVPHISLSTVSFTLSIHDLREYARNFLLSISRNAPNVETLRLELRHYPPARELDIVPLLPQKRFTITNLKKLEIILLLEPEMDLLAEMLPLLAAAPCLEQFRLYLSCFTASHQHHGDPNTSRDKTFSHDHLKSIEIYGFCGCTNQIEFASCILKCASPLTTMTVACVGDGRERRHGDADINQSDSWRRASLLNLNLPSKVRLTISWKSKNILTVFSSRRHSLIYLVKTHSFFQLSRNDNQYYVKKPFN